NPLLAAAVLPLVLGIALVVGGIMRIILAFGMKEGMPWMWIVLSGVITLLLGVIILSHWPVSSLYVLGIFLGVDLIFAGVGWIGLGLGLRRAAAEVRAGPERGAGGCNGKRSGSPGAGTGGATLGR